MALIVDMKMPMNCYECPMRRNYAIQDKERGTTYCAILNLSNGDFTDRRPRWCPILHKIPDEHGRLIDADAYENERIMNACRNCDCETCDECSLSYALNEIKNAPTVLEAT